MNIHASTRDLAGIVQTIPKHLTYFKNLSMSNLFILGFEKCGTSAVADYLIKNNLATYLVPDTKEPYIYTYSNPPQNIEKMRMYLDASVGYIKDRSVIDKLPEHNTKIIICLKNQFDRTWSSYKMSRIIITDNNDTNLYVSTYPTRVGNHVSSNPLQRLLDLIKLLYPVRSHKFIEEYFQIEVGNFKAQNFLQRIFYEISFYLRRGEFPFFSILAHSFYASPIKYLLGKYTSEQVSLITVNKIKSNSKLRNSFIKEIFDVEIESPNIPIIYSSEEFSIGEEKPDFLQSEFDFIRKIFFDDIEALKVLLVEKGISDTFMDKVDLAKNLIK